MLRFFRKIRLNLMSENKVSKYLIYAIGEILLVVLGILIALQVNNWNEGRKAQIVIQKSAMSLIQDLEKDLAMVEIIENQARLFKTRLDSLTSYLRIKEFSAVSNVETYCLSYGTMYRPYTWHRSTLEALINANDLANIKNDTISQRIIEYYSFTQHLDEDFQHDYDTAEKVDDLRSKIINKNLSNVNDLSASMRSFTNSGDYSGVQPFSFYTSKAYLEAKAKDLELITKNPDDLKIFANLIMGMKGNLSIRIDIELPRLKRQAYEIIQLLKEEY